MITMWQSQQAAASVWVTSSCIFGYKNCILNCITVYCHSWIKGILSVTSTDFKNPLLSTPHSYVGENAGSQKWLVFKSHLNVEIFFDGN